MAKLTRNDMFDIIDTIVSGTNMHKTALKRADITQARADYAYEDSSDPQQRLDYYAYRIAEISLIDEQLDVIRFFLETEADKINKKAHPFMMKLRKKEEAEASRKYTKAEAARKYPNKVVKKRK